jgi:exo-beta-1,3-glucanase (GH17 family)
MRSTLSLNLRIGASDLRRICSTIAIALSLTACGGGTTSDNGIQVAGSSFEASGLRALPSDFSSLKAVAYGPYRTSNNATEVLTDDNVKQDLQLLVKAGFGLIRIYNSGEQDGMRILRVINADTDLKKNIKVMQGIWINSFEYYTGADAATVKAQISKDNDAEILRGVLLANSYPETVVAVSVGNETLDDWEYNPKVSTRQLAKYIKTVRSQIAQPVTTDDSYAAYAGKTLHHAGDNNISEVLAQIDFASIHTYPISDVPWVDVDSIWAYWDWKQSGVADTTKRAAAMMDAAILKTKADYAKARAYLDSKGKALLPIMIGEAGWKVSNDTAYASLRAMSSPANQKMYYQRLIDWWSASATSSTGPRNIVYFEAFDEPWKVTINDGWWGLFNSARKARFAIQNDPKSTIPSSTYEMKALRMGGTSAYADADAMYFGRPADVATAINATRYTLYADTVPAGTPLASASAPDLTWDAFDGDTVVRNEADTNAPGSDDSQNNTLSIKPNPRDYGWGLLYHSVGMFNDNLITFTTTGSLNFSVKTAYQGSVKIGLSTDTANGGSEEAFVQVSNGKYGYCNTNAWCKVSIPLSAFTAINSKLDFSFLQNRFIIADIYADTGNTKGQKAEIHLDAIYYAK